MADKLLWVSALRRRETFPPILHLGRIAKLVVEPDIEKNLPIGDVRRVGVLVLKIVKKVLGCLLIISTISS